MNRKIEIRDCMERALDTELELSGSVSYHRTCPNAPNPAIQVEGLGTIGLPLSSRDVEALKSKAHKVTFDKCERTEVDVTICDTWEMDAKTVVLANPDWQTFLTNTVTEVCDVLGVVMEAGASRYELFKLLFHGTGSHSLPHFYTEKGDGTFATIIFVLPSEFTGGQSRVNYDATSEVYDCSTKSLFQTSVMAWYTGVTHELKPISSGYRLVLTYHLVHTSESPLPAVSTNTQFTKEVSAPFDQWREAGDEGPQKLVYLLSHKYSETGIRRSALKGEDAVRLAILSVISKELGFQLGLSNVFCTIGGVACEYSRDPKTGTYSGGRDIDPNVV
ncbi:hypothetical protein C8Q75DRAFT_226148 [Abortiporus biennis]|nr:hypothetical protein C8Q75DRAFT_226148 [Abortiporus biennis]